MTTLQATKKKLKNELVNGLDNTFQLLEVYLSPESGWYNSYLLSKGNYKSISKEFISGLLNYSEYNQANQKIAHAILLLIDELTEADINAPVITEESKSTLPGAALSQYKSYRRPTPKATRIAELFNSYHVVVGDAIEICSHPNLNNRIPIEKCGWDPMDTKDIQLINSNAKFDIGTLRSEFADDPTLRPPNKRKYCLSQLVGGLVDEPTLTLHTKHSDFITIKSLVNHYQADIPESIYEKYGNLKPEDSLIPNSTCLHYIVLLDDGHILCQHRSKDLAYHPSKFSFTQEEQLDEEDFHAETPTLAHLMIRALCEEIFPLSGDSSKIITNFDQYVKPLVASMRIWSVFIEASLANFSLMGVIHLNITKQEYINLFKNYLHIGTIDREADLYAINQENLTQLITEGSAQVSGLFNGTPKEIHHTDLHPTALYRAYKLLQQLEKNK